MVENCQPILVANDRLGIDHARLNRERGYGVSGQREAVLAAGNVAASASKLS
jgi:hypothetical protein